MDLKIWTENDNLEKNPFFFIEIFEKKLVIIKIEKLLDFKIWKNSKWKILKILKKLQYEKFGRMKMVNFVKICVNFQ